MPPRREESFQGYHFTHSDEVIDISFLINQLKVLLPGIIFGVLMGSILGWTVSFGMPKSYRSVVLAEFIGSPMSRLLNPLDESSGKAEAGRSLERYALTVLDTPRAKVMAHEILASRNIDSEKISFSVRSVPSTNLFSFEARGQDREVLQEAANAWAESASQWLAKFQVDGARQSFDSLNRYYEDNKKILSLIRDQIEHLRPTLETKKSLYKIKKDQLSVYDLELEQMKSAVNRAQAELPVLQEEIKKHEKIRAAVKLATDGNQEIISSVIVNSGQNQPLQGEWRSVTYSVNPLFAELERRISENEVSLKTMQSRRQNLEELSKLTHSEMMSLGSEIASLETKIESLDRDLQVARKEYDLLYAKLGESRLASSLNPSLLNVINPAASVERVSSTIFYVGAGALLGILTGILGSLLNTQKRKALVSKSIDQDHLRSVSRETVSLP